MIHVRFYMSNSADILFQKIHENLPTGLWFFMCEGYVPYADLFSSLMIVIIKIQGDL